MCFITAIAIVNKLNSAINFIMMLHLVKTILEFMRVFFMLTVANALKWISTKDN